MTSMKMALESILDKKGRSFLTMLGIIIGVCAVLVLVSLVSGYNADITAYYEKMGVNKVEVDITYYDSGHSPDMTDLLYEYGNTELSSMVTGVTPDISATGTLKFKSNSNTTATVYLGGDQFSTCRNYVLKKGRPLNEYDLSSRNKVCVIGSYVAESLFGYANPIDEVIYFNSSPYTVVGVYYQKDGTEESSMDDMIVVPYTLNREINSSGVISSFIVKVDMADHMDSVMTALEEFFAEYVDAYTGEVTLTNGNSALAESDEETASISIVLGGIAGIALLVGGIGIMNIMLVTVTERTREIGIKKAIGAPRSAIVSQFLVESSVLSATGGVIGILLGYGLSVILGKAIYNLILMPNVSITIAAFLFSIAIGIGFGMYPAVKASGLQPVDALRAD